MQHSIELINKEGFESFTFKKLAKSIGTTEAGVYRYFENKHRLLIYIVTWYWSWLEYQIGYHINNISEPRKRLEIIIKLLASTVLDDERTSYINESILHQIVISEGSKAYLTKHVSEDNKLEFFQPYKDLCSLIGNIISECNANYKYPKSLASTIIEMAHIQNFFMHYLPALTDFDTSKDEDEIVNYLNDLVLSAVGV